MTKEVALDKVRNIRTWSELVRLVIITNSSQNLASRQRRDVGIIAQ